jgi:predicted nucleic acid-binding Zn ribbon protein
MEENQESRPRAPEQDRVTYGDEPKKKKIIQHDESEHKGQCPRCGGEMKRHHEGMLCIKRGCGNYVKFRRDTWDDEWDDD